MCKWGVYFTTKAQRTLRISMPADRVKFVLHACIANAGNPYISTTDYTDLHRLFSEQVQFANLFCRTIEIE